MSRQSDQRRSFGRQCYQLLMDRLHNRISLDEFEEKLNRLDAQRQPPPQQTSFVCMDCGCSPCECPEREPLDL